MNWKFWRKENHHNDSPVAGEIKLAKPRELPQGVGWYLVTQLKLDPDWVWGLRCALRPKPDEKGCFDIRVFNPASTASKGVNVLNYNSLDLHPDMVLFFGSFNKRTGQVLFQQSLEKVA